MIFQEMVYTKANLGDEPDGGSALPMEWMETLAARLSEGYVVTRDGGKANAASSLVSGSHVRVHPVKPFSPQMDQLLMQPQPRETCCDLINVEGPANTMVAWFGACATANIMRFYRLRAEQHFAVQLEE